MSLQKPSQTVLLNLREIRESPPSVNVYPSFNIIDPVNDSSVHTDATQTRGDVAADNIDWDISVDSSQIDWDIGTVEEPEDASNGLGPYEMVNADEVLQNFEPNVVTGYDQNKSNEEDSAYAEINWDISVDTQVEVVHDASFQHTDQENQKSILDLEQANDIKEERSQLLETEYRNRILDDLYEVDMQIKHINIRVCLTWVAHML